MGMWLVFLPAPFLIARMGEVVGAPISDRVVLMAMVIFAALFLLPALLSGGGKIRLDTWNRAVFAAAFIYDACTRYNHTMDLSHLQQYADLDDYHYALVHALSP